MGCQGTAFSSLPGLPHTLNCGLPYSDLPKAIAQHEKCLEAQHPHPERQHGCQASPQPLTSMSSSVARRQHLFLAWPQEGFREFIYENYPKHNKHTIKLGLISRTPHISFWGSFLLRFHQHKCWRDKEQSWKLVFLPPSFPFWFSLTPYTCNTTPSHKNTIIYLQVKRKTTNLDCFLLHGNIIPFLGRHKPCPPILRLKDKPKLTLGTQ